MCLIDLTNIYTFALLQNIINILNNNLILEVAKMSHNKRDISDYVSHIHRTNKGISYFGTFYGILTLDTWCKQGG